jgi:hypothetical protein
MLKNKAKEIIYQNDIIKWLYYPNKKLEF